MPRAKPSAWQPKGLEVFDTSDLYSDDDLVKLIIHHLGTHSKKKTRKILVQLRNITGLLRAGLHYRKRPTHGEKEESLRIVARATRTMLSALEALDADTRRLLESEADQSPEEVDIVIDGQKVWYQVKAVGIDITKFAAASRFLKNGLKQRKRNWGLPRSPEKSNLMMRESLCRHS